MALVVDKMDGNTHVLIYDDCCKTTKAEVDAILARCARIALDAWEGEAMMKARAEAKAIKQGNK